MNVKDIIEGEIIILTHFNEDGRAKMVDIANKEATARTAIAMSSVQMSYEVYNAIQNQKIKKGDVLSVAQVAGIMAAKQTSSLIPMCHPISISGINITFNWKELQNNIELSIQTEVKTVGSTGVEMEALTAASITALTIYDMCKAVDKSMLIGSTYLLEKSGGKSGDYKRI
jgi:cyclic pyranopterin monophosphate synthase